MHQVMWLQQELVAELERHRNEVFDVPPSDWAGFQLRLGAYRATLDHLTKVRSLLRDPDKDLK